MPMTERMKLLIDMHFALSFQIIIPLKYLFYLKLFLQKKKKGKQAFFVFQW